MGTYIALDNLNNGRHLPGDALELSDAAAESLLRLRVIREATPEELAAARTPAEPLLQVIDQTTEEREEPAGGSANAQGGDDAAGADGAMEGGTEATDTPAPADAAPKAKAKR
ncbi:hypothetical protein [Methylogaea oryzae]|uniref:Uncharacterized protein n=1 Tax=Methylogaea oryzae TaxID=1295382 RepID=A0A8D4VLZ2_9GAMM|nr:hypothetical protein [Methylogaea oryzae]BBL69699.1 hypothetical protein MoryE10_03050 [Methylogaea oryzae]